MQAEFCVGWKTFPINSQKNWTESFFRIIIWKSLFDAKKYFARRKQTFCCALFYYVWSKNLLSKINIWLKMSQELANLNFPYKQNKGHTLDLFLFFIFKCHACSIFLVIFNFLQIDFRCRASSWERKTTLKYA